MKKYDVLVIGSGGGTKISTPAANIGYKAAIIEKSKWGGTCLNRGCIPSKMFIHPANVAQQIREAKKYGIKSSISSIDFPKLVKRINRETDADSRSIPRFYNKKKNLDYFHGHAKFLSNKIVEVNGEKLTAKKIFVATGASPFVPKIPGLEGTPFMTSTEALRNRKKVKKLLVLGGGYIGCELGHAYGSLGSEVHLLVRGKELLAREDLEVRREFTKQFAKHYHVHFNINTEKIEYKKGKFVLTLRSKKGLSKISGDGLLVATGVQPNTKNLGLENTSIRLTSKGFIKVNHFLETSVKNIYALGDVVGNYMFRHSVNFEGEYLFRTHFKEKKKKPIKYPPMPHAVFSYPEIASVGKTEDQLKEEKTPYFVGLNWYKDSAQGMARIPETGFVKLLFHKKNKKLLGAHIIGEEAATMVHQLIYAMTFDAKLEDLLKVIYIHPALPEIVRNAVRKAQ